MSEVDEDRSGGVGGEGRHYRVLLNRSAGTLKEVWDEELPGRIEGWFRGAGVVAEVEVVPPPGLGEAFGRAVGSGVEAVVVGGGDGTVSGAAACLAGSGVALGVLPYGTFNLAARDAGVPLEPEAAVEALAGAEAEATDVLDVGGERTCLCAVLLGFYPAMGMRQRAYHGPAWWRKLVQIVAGSVRAFRRWAPLDLEIETGVGEKLARRTRFVALVPGEYEDVVSVIPKRRTLSGARMSVYVSRHETSWALWRGVLRYLLGRMGEEEELERIEAGEVRLSVRGRRTVPAVIDGELVKLGLPVRVVLCEGGLMMLRPRGREGGR